MVKITDKPDFHFEEQFHAPVAGIDEAGRGPLAGPVVAAAVILDPANVPPGLNDSKKLSHKKREQLFHVLQDCADIGVGIIEPLEIDEINILQATYKAMIQASEALSTRPQHCLVDGNRLPKLNMDATAVVKGDSKSLSIAAASIIAKVTRDRIMIELDRKHPEYGWAKNMGYGTQAHRDAINIYGPTPFHRMSFAPLNTFQRFK